MFSAPSSYSCLQPARLLSAAGSYKQTNKWRAIAGLRGLGLIDSPGDLCEGCARRLIAPQRPLGSKILHAATERREDTVVKYIYNCLTSSSPQFDVIPEKMYFHLHGILHVHRLVVLITAYPVALNDNLFCQEED